MHLVITQVLDYITGSIVIVSAIVVFLLLYKLILDLQVGMSIYLIVDDYLLVDQHKTWEIVGSMGLRM